MDEHFDFDLIIIGGGSAGYAAARTGHSEGLRTCVIDSATELGGLCILRGCMPSKALIESANRRLAARHAADFGLRLEDHGVDMPLVRQRKRSLIADFASYRQGQLAGGRFVLHRAAAAFVDAHTLHLTPCDGSAAFQLRAHSFVIATGSEVFIPDVPDLQEAGYWTSDDVLDAETLPQSVIVLGGGAIALELAHYLEAMGCRITLIQRSEGLLTGLDRECGDAIRAAYEKRGMQIFCSTQLISIQAEKGVKKVHFTQNGQSKTVEAQEVLVTLGRQPATRGLQHEKIGIAVEKRKISVNTAQQTTLSHIFAAGDVSSSLDVVHVAIQQGEIAARNAARLIRGESAFEHRDDRLRLYGVFSHPQVATVGATAESLHASGIPFIEASYPFNDHGMSMVMGEVDGFVKLRAHAGTGELLGACVTGPKATELIHEIVVAMHFRATARDLALIPHYHPTLSEIWTYPAEELADQVP